LHRPMAQSAVSVVEKNLRLGSHIHDVQLPPRLRHSPSTTRQPTQKRIACRIHTYRLPLATPPSRRKPRPLRACHIFPNSLLLIVRNLGTLAGANLPR
jgi:hypothetical protein